MAMAIEDGAGRKKRPVPARAWGKANQVCESLIRLLNNTPVFRLIALVGALVGFVVIVGTAWQIWNDYIDRREDRIDRAWNRLLRPLPGNSGKADAFEYLVGAGLSLSGANLSCKAIGNYDPVGGKCAMAPVFQDLDIGSAAGDIVELEAIDFSGLAFRNLMITNVWLKDLNFEGAKIDELIAQGAYLDVNGSAASMTDCSFPGSAVRDLFFGYEGETFCNFSDTLFVGVVDPIFGTSARGFAWADAPPYVVVPPVSKLLGPQEIRPWVEAIGQLEIDLCAVPVNEDGIVSPVRERKRGTGSCERLELEQAQQLYPASYKSAKLWTMGNPDPRWTPGVLGRVKISLSGYGS